MDESTKKVYIEGMNDNHSKLSVKETLKQLRNVEDVYADLEDKSAIIRSHAEIDDATLTVAIQNAGFKVVSIE